VRERKKIQTDLRERENRKTDIMKVFECEREGGERIERQI